VVSIALAMENPEMAVIWRGPLLSKAIQQFLDRRKLGRTGLPACGHAAWNQRCAANGDADAPTSGRSSSNLSTGHGTFSGKESVPHGKSASSACAWFGRKHELRSLPPLRREVFLSLVKKPLSEAAQEFNVQVCAEMPLDPQLAELTDKGDIENIGESIGLTLQKYGGSFGIYALMQKTVCQLERTKREPVNWLPFFFVKSCYLRIRNSYCSCHTVPLHSKAKSLTDEAYWYHGAAVHYLCW